MGSKFSIRAIWNTARCEFIKLITNPRIIIVGIMLVFIKTLVIEPLVGRAEKYGEPLNILEPFIAVGNSGKLVMFMPCVFLILISDFPIMGGNTLFFIKRTGKLNWFLGQILSIIMSIFTYIAVIFTSCLIMGKGVWSNHCSNSITKYEAAFPQESGNFVSQLLPSNLYNQIPIVTAAIQTIILLSMYFFLLSLILCMLKMLYLRTAGLFTVFLVIGCGVMTCSIKAPAMWIFPMANSIIWLHYKEILREPITPVANSFVYFAVIITVIFIANLVVLRRLQFINTEQEGT